MATPPIPDPDKEDTRIPPLPTPSAAPAAPVPGQAPPGQGLQRLIWFILGTVVMLILSPATVMLLLFGLLPTVVAGVIDRTEGKFATFCVFGMNFSGLLPFLTDVWFGDHSIDAAIEIMTDPLDLMIIYGSAAFGWFVYTGVPPFIMTFITAMTERRVGILRENQNKIIEEWGEDIASALETADQDAPEAAEAAAPR